MKTAKVEVPLGTKLPLVLHNAISTRSARPGDPVYLETLFPVVVEGKIMIPAGSFVGGEIVETKRAGPSEGPRGADDQVEHADPAERLRSQL